MRSNRYLAIFWDFLVWSLVLFPLIAGGVWIRQPGLKIEVTELAVPVLIVSLLGILFQKVFKTSLEQVSSARFMKCLWKSWFEAVGSRPYKTLWSVVGVLTLIWGFASLRRHWAYESGAADLGIFTNAIWNLTHGYGYVSSLKDGINLFADHQSPLFWIFAPFFWLIPRPETLLVLQSFGLVSGGVAIYCLGKQYLPEKHWGIAALPLLYWGYLPLRAANAFDFHPETLMLPLYLWAIVGLQSEKIRSRFFGGLAFVMALGAKESAGPVAVGIGISWLIGAGPAYSRSWTRKVGVAAVLVGVFVFHLDTKIVPKLLGTHYAYDQNYAGIGTDLGSLIFAPFTKPDIFWPLLVGKTRLKFLFFTLAPLGFIPLLGWRAAFAAIPGYLMLFLSGGDHRVNLIYHYAIEPSVGLFWAMPTGLIVLERLGHSDRSGFLRRPELWVLFFALLFFGRSETYRVRSFSPSNHEHWLSTELIPALSPDRSLVASGSLVPHLAIRHWAHHLPNIQIPGGLGLGSSSSLVECAVFDQVENNWPMTPDEFKQMPSVLLSRDYRLIFTCGPTTVYQYGDASCLVRTPTCTGASESG
jgi:uncharacterized membrane protein